MTFRLSKSQSRFVVSVPSPLSPQIYFCIRNWRRPSLRVTSGLLLAVCTLGYAQNHAIRIYGTVDSEIAMPDDAGALGRKDATALAEIQQYQKAIGASQWTGMQGAGTIAQGDQGSMNASLAVLHRDNFRLDVTTSQGVRSIRMSDANGQIQESDGKKHILPVATAKNGLLAFPRLLDSAFPGSQVALLDHGLIQIEGKALHRITLEEAIFPDNTESAQDNTSVLDLYFDPTSHLLIKSAEYIQLDSSDRARYLQVVTYGDYRQVDGMLLPFQYSQTLNGQKQWTLALTEVHLAPVSDASYFLF